jgi:hypothetical protein
MAVEPKRGCGYRKVGGIYLVSGGEGRPCGPLYRYPYTYTLAPFVAPLLSAEIAIVDPKFNAVYSQDTYFTRA